MVNQAKHAEGTVDAANRPASEGLERLKQAVQHGGGATTVSRQTGIPPRTLGYYLAGREMRLSTLVAIAQACGVSVEWLATGKEFHLPGEPARISITDSQDGHAEAGMHRVVEQSSSNGLFETVDVLKMGAAIDYVENALRSQNRSITTVERARAVLIAYDLLHLDPESETVVKSTEGAKSPASDK